MSVLVMALVAASAPTAWAKPAEWVFHSFPKDNKFVNGVAALGDTLFMVADFGHKFYRSTDHGETWQSQDTALKGGRLYNLERFSGEVFLFGDDGIRRSRDRGATWVPAQGGLGTVMVKSMFEMGQVLYAVAVTGFFRSTNRGDSWTRVMAPMDPSILTMTEVQGTLYFSCITMNQDSSLFRSTDNGLSWHLFPTPGERLVWVDRVEGHAEFLFLASGSNLFRTRPDSAAWTRLDPSSPLPAFWHLQSDGASLRAFGRAGAYHSADTGKTWVRDTPSEDHPEIGLKSVDGARMIGTITSGYHLVESKDFGATWTRLNQPFNLQGRTTLVSSGPNLLAYTPGKSVFLTANLGLSWARPGMSRG
jgi:photosystem II stability/assembly factor-like uncharacterized protein